MKKTIIFSALSLTIAVLGSACNSSSTAVPIGDSIRTVTDSSSMPSTMSPSNDTSNMSNMGKDSMVMDTSNMKSKMKHK